MKKTLLLSLLAASSLGAAEFNPDVIDSEAVWYLHTDMESVRETTFGKIALALITAETGEVLHQIETYTGFNLIEDVEDFTLYGKAADKDAILLVNANIDEEGLTKVATNDDDYQATAHGGNTVHTWTDDDNGKTNHASIFNGKTIIISEQKNNVKLALDILTKKVESFTLNNPISVHAPIFLGLADVKKLNIPHDDEGAKLIKLAETIAMSLHENGKELKLGAVIKTGNEKTASRVRSILDGLIAMTSLTYEDEDFTITSHSVEQVGDAVKAEIQAPISSILSKLKDLRKL